MEQVVGGESYIEREYRLDHTFCGKGISSEAARSIRDSAFNQLDIPYPISIIHTDNIASKMVADSQIDKIGHL